MHKSIIYDVGRHTRIHNSQYSPDDKVMKIPEKKIYVRKFYSNNCQVNYGKTIQI